jgi:hypothetical protein
VLQCDEEEDDDDNARSSIESITTLIPRTGDWTRRDGQVPGPRRLKRPAGDFINPLNLTQTGGTLWRLGCELGLLGVNMEPRRGPGLGGWCWCLGCLALRTEGFGGVGWEAGLLLQLRGSDLELQPSLLDAGWQWHGNEWLGGPMSYLTIHLEARDKEDGGVAGMHHRWMGNQTRSLPPSQLPSNGVTPVYSCHGSRRRMSLGTGGERIPPQLL